MVRVSAPLRRKRESSQVPVDPGPPIPVIGPLPHFRKLAFAFGAIATFLALLLATHLIGGTP